MIVFLILAYTFIPPAVLYFCLNEIYQKKSKYGWHIIYLIKFLIVLSFLPLLSIQGLNFGFIPAKDYSIILFIVTVLASVVGIKQAISKKVVYFYIGGIYASFMEEILFRGIIFGLAQLVWNNIYISVAVSSLAFGIWHLKNIAWHGVKKSIIQFFYTAFIYGPIFCLMRIYTQDLYLVIFFHYITDATVALAPNWMRGWLVYGGRDKYDLDNYTSN